MIVSSSERASLRCVRMTNNIWDTKSCKTFFYSRWLLFTLRTVKWKEIATLMFEARNDFEIQLQFITSRKASRQETNGVIKQRRNRNSISFDSWCFRSETSKTEELIDPSDTRLTLTHFESIERKWCEQYGIVRNSRTTNSSKGFCKIIK